MARQTDRIIAQLWMRKAEGYVPGSYSDGHHIALAAEGGGMRGVATGGMVSAIEDLGLTHCFDSVHGSSAGGAACAYLVAGQAKLGTRIFYEDLNDRRFINMRRMWRLQPIMDKAFLVDHVMDKIKPIDFNAIQRSGTRLHIVCTDIDAGEAQVFAHFASYPDYREILKASIALPFIAGRPVHVHGKRLMDGGLVQQIAVDSAFAAGATMVLGFQTRRRDEQMRPETSVGIQLQARLLQKAYGGKLGALYRARNATINRSVGYLEAGMGPDGQVMGGLQLRDDITDLHRLTKDADLLRRGAQMTMDAAIARFRTVQAALG
ncbi:MAG: patatin-like phospholipase family protein [Pseudomonadota bacterium]